jgi:hypothetical protein
MESCDEVWAVVAPEAGTRTSRDSNELRPAGRRAAALGPRADYSRLPSGRWGAYGGGHCRIRQRVGDFGGYLNLAKGLPVNFFCDSVR